jgi:hypothetical protein
MSDQDVINQYNELPSYELVLVLKDCKFLLKGIPSKTTIVKNTMTVIRDILVSRQKVGNKG